MPQYPSTRLHVVAAALALTASGACAQDFPSRALRIVVPYVPGGSTDIVARTLAARMGENIGQQIVVDNRGGGATIPATEGIVKAPADGYTMMLANIALGANPSLFRKLPYDAERDLAPVSLVAIMPTVLVVHPSIPARNVKSLIALAKSRPGAMNYGSAGNGSVNHLTMEVFRATAGIDLVHIPYKGGGPAFIDLMGGQLSAMFATIVATSHHIKAGRLIALGVSSSKRSSVLPDVPTVAEAGLPGFDVLEWQILVAPARTPPAVLERLNSEVVKVLQHPEARERIVGLGAEPIGSSTRDAAAFLKTELARWAKVAKEARIQPVD
jgi:tripartite-type tricarboxylate transporter receptor subunit TctC